MITIKNLKSINESFQYGYPDFENADLETYDAIFESYVCKEANEALNEGVLGAIGNAIITFFKKIAELFMAIVSKIASLFGGSSGGGGGGGSSSSSGSSGSSSGESSEPKEIEVLYFTSSEYTENLDEASELFTKIVSTLRSSSGLPEVVDFMLDFVSFDAAKTKKPEACVNEFSDSMQKYIKKLKNSDKEDKDDALKLFTNMRNLVMGDYSVLDSNSPVYDAHELKRIISGISDACLEIKNCLKESKDEISQELNKMFADEENKKKVTDRSKAINEINQVMPIIKKDVSMLSAQSKDYSDLASRMAKSEEAAQSKYANMNQDLIKSLTTARLNMWKAITTTTYSTITTYLMIVRKLYTANEKALSQLSGKVQANKGSDKPTNTNKPSTPSPENKPSASNATEPENKPAQPASNKPQSPAPQQKQQPNNNQEIIDDVLNQVKQNSLIIKLDTVNKGGGKRDTQSRRNQNIIGAIINKDKRVDGKLRKQIFRRLKDDGYLNESADDTLLIDLGYLRYLIYG